MYLAHVICGLSLTEIGALFSGTARRSRMRAAWSRTGATIPRSTPDRASRARGRVPDRRPWLAARSPAMRSSKPLARGNVGRARPRDPLIALKTRKRGHADTRRRARLPSSPLLRLTLPPCRKTSGGEAGRGLPRARLARPGGRALRLSHVGRAWLRRSAAEGDAFRAQHQVRGSGEREIDGTRRPVLLNEAESPLGWLKSRKDRNGSPLLTGQQYEAGERLRADYWFAQMSPRVTANWSALAPSDVRAEARRRAPPISATR